MDALGRTLAQMDINQEYIQNPNKNNDLSFEQPFIISNVRYINCLFLFMYFILCSFIIGNGTSCISKFDIR
jgi:hypothetical protein